jgi:hypothetical protein
MTPGRVSAGSILALGSVALCLVTRATMGSASIPLDGDASVGPQGCEPSIRGAVIRDQDFERSFGDDLIFRLAATRNSPPNPQEWTIEIRPRAFPDHEYSYYASPPYRFWNPRYVGTSYGYTAARAVAHDVREFRFLTSEEDHTRAHRAIGIVLWPGNHSADEVERTSRALAQMAHGRGTLRILDSRLAPPTEERPLGSIERLEFETTLCLPDDDAG